jgi:hypothetical protein
MDRLIEASALQAVVNALLAAGRPGLRGLAGLELASRGCRAALQAAYFHTVMAPDANGRALHSLALWLVKHRHVGALHVTCMAGGGGAAGDRTPLIGQEVALRRLLDVLPGVTSVACLSLQGLPAMWAAHATDGGGPPRLTLFARKNHFWQLKALSLRCGPTLPGRSLAWSAASRAPQFIHAACHL